MHRTKAGEGRSSPFSRETFLPHLTGELPTLIGTTAREVTFILQRQETGWSADLSTSLEKEPPLHARTIPSMRDGSAAETHRQVLDASRRIARLMSVPRGGRAALVARVSLDDARIVDWEPERLHASGDGLALSASESEVPLLVAALLPFTRGFGERTLSLSMKGEHRNGESLPRWSLEEARVLEPAPPPSSVADIHQEYRAIHESILTQFQEQTREYAVLAAGFTLEQLAYSLVGGLALKGGWVLVGKGAPTVLSFLSKGGRGAVLWFRNLLVRTPTADRELLVRLWMKAETQGLKALTEVEKQELRALMIRMEKVLETPLDDTAKNRLWAWAREEYFSLYHPQFAKLLGEAGLRAYEVHHLYPMRYAHLFPKLDINGRANLVGLHVDVHRSVNAVWLSLGRAAQRMKPQDVTQVVETINHHYSRWFHKVYNPADAAALANAQRAALGEVAALKALLVP
ncbi:hypothetical protein [Hyalangium gracile]|uniref:hypothetical protein n=1 Tax=Hyalangium gracile TaxID=394092 RepID=UPI001CCBE9A8|nr:hypothetical protein [Hyalangium gracile]